MDMILKPAHCTKISHQNQSACNPLGCHWEASCLVRPDVVPSRTPFVSSPQAILLACQQPSKKAERQSMVYLLIFIGLTMPCRIFYSPTTHP
jgi:hypothetical protein